MPIRGPVQRRNQCSRPTKTSSEKVSIPQLLRCYPLSSLVQAQHANYVFGMPIISVVGTGSRKHGDCYMPLMLMPEPQRNSSMDIMLEPHHVLYKGTMQVYEENGLLAYQNEQMKIEWADAPYTKKNQMEPRAMMVGQHKPNVRNPLLNHSNAERDWQLLP